jgi:hypothetical protein
MKIVVAGTQGSGKTAFIKALDSKAMCVEEPMNKKNSAQDTTTVAMDIGALKIDDIPITLFGTPGFARFSAMRTILFKGADAMLFFMDGANTEQDKDLTYIFKEILSEFTDAKRRIPIIIVSTKMDIKNARTAADVAVILKEALSVVEFATILKNVDARVFEISSHAKKNLQELMKYVLEKIIQKWKPTLQTAIKYQANISELQKILNLDQDAFRDFLNDLEIRKLITLDRKNLTFSITSLGQKFLN